MRKLALLLPLLFLTTTAEAANRYWVGGGSSANWNATGNTNWGTASNTQDNASVPGAGDDVIFDGVGTGASNSTLSASITVNSVNFTGYTNTLTHSGGATLTAGGGGNVTFVAGMTYTPTHAESAGSAAAITISGGTVTFTTGGQAMPRINLTGGATKLGDNLTFGASKFIFLTLSGNNLDLNGKTVASNSILNRVLVQSDTLGTARTITINSGTFTNCDFADITASSAIDLSAGSSGDAGGNTNITFTTPASQTATGTSGFTWSTHGWTSRVPLPQDDVSIPNAFSASQTITWDMVRSGKSVTFTCTGNPILDPSIDVAIYGSLTLASGMDWSSGNDALFMRGRGSYNLTTNGVAIETGGQGNAIQAPGGTVTFQDNVTWGGDSTHGITLSNGTLDTNTFSLTTPQLTGTGTATRALDMASSTITLTGTGTVWSFATTTGLTFTSTGSTIEMTDVSASAKTFAGGGLTYGALSITSDGSAGTTTFSGSNTFTGWTIGAAGAKAIILTSGTTQTFSTASSGLGNGTNVITFTESGGTDPIISCSSGTFSWDYLSLTAIPSAGGAAFYAGANSTNGGGNTGWTFTAPPAGRRRIIIT